ncbi:MAG: septal ring lytic transglycosylase RlpA family protein [Burkholderiales bacterium]|nr:septal ring lytic transglycosylase RlpA family protein [Burkholderiales bacterium]
MPRLPFRRRWAASVTCATLLVAACGTSPPKSPSAPSASAGTASSRYYKDDGPPDTAPANLDQVPDAVPKLEPLHRFANRPYTVLGQDFVPATALRPYKERGVASWYGRKFHGQKTSIGDTYDMFQMTAAHPTLPLPSYAKVTNVSTGQSVVVRVNDRGPFLHGRIIDLSYAAAYRVGIAQRGSGEVEVEAVIPGVSPMLAAAPPLAPVAREATPAAPVMPAIPPAPAPGFAVQLGVFQTYVNARTFLAHVQGQLATAEVEPRVRETNGLYRVYVGPYTDREEAKRVAERISNAFGMATAIAVH